MNYRFGYILACASMSAVALLPVPGCAQDFTASSAAAGPVNARTIAPGRLWIRPYEVPVTWVFPAWQGISPFAILGAVGPLIGSAPSGPGILNTGSVEFVHNLTSGSGNNNGNGNVGSNNGNGNVTNGKGNFGVGDNRGNGNAAPLADW
ncbi:hypothetical protein ACRAWG_19225 [Methylobacterium sp. P31]